MGWRTILAGWVGSRKRFFQKGKSGALLAYLFRLAFRLRTVRILQTPIKPLILLNRIKMAEGVGFEPTVRMQRSLLLIIPYIPSISLS